MQVELQVNIFKMELRDIREGNYVKESEFSSRDRALVPSYRVEYRDLGYHQFMIGIPITLDWCKSLDMDIHMKEPWATASNFDWIAYAPGLKVKSNLGEVTVFLIMGGGYSILEHIKYVHQIQNFYYGMWGFEIDEENPTEFYKITKHE